MLERNEQWIRTLFSNEEEKNINNNNNSLKQIEPTIAWMFRQYENIVKKIYREWKASIHIFHMKIHGSCLKDI